ncbi:CAAX protease self-immunity [Geodermatophilus obscurus]|uniref:CAAX protease self-immunity n=1 Tax=Geodermatophilus obscurus TaxID=1861 RepID=A0A1I5ER48_9ACTN|nr:CPBP family glutamic-type intramembrane protease [Geodermatophilus obscurus]SFO13995.1 CAAX protease self-immunity [Geodermatophilus obscurus]
MSTLDDPRSPRRAPGPGSAAGGFRAFARRRPITALLLVAIPLGWAILGVPALATHGLIPGGDLPVEVFALALTVLVMLPATVWVVSAAEGRAGVRVLFSRTFRWRFGPAWWATVLVALPVTTVAVAVALGESVQTADLASTLAREVPLMLLPIVLVNMWEETVWAGFVQTRLERRHGLLAAAALTAVAFAGIHLPMLLADDDLSASSFLAGAAILFGAALVVRVMVGVFLRATAGSVLAVAVLHGSWNGSTGEGGLVDDLLSGGQPVLAGVIAAVLVTAGVAALVRPALTRRSEDRTDRPAGTTTGS